MSIISSITRGLKRTYWKAKKGVRAISRTVTRPFKSNNRLPYAEWKAKMQAQGKWDYSRDRNGSQSSGTAYQRPQTQQSGGNRPQRKGWIPFDEWKQQRIASGQWVDRQAQRERMNNGEKFIYRRRKP